MKENFLRRLGALTLSLALVLSLTTAPAVATEGEDSGGTPPPAGESIPATSIKLDQEKISKLYTGKTAALVATVEPENSTDSVEWNSDASDIATVDDKGVVTGIKAGKATITAKAGSQTATCEVTVEDAIHATSINFVTENLVLKGRDAEEGKQHALRLITNPTSATIEDSDVSVVIVEDGGEDVIEVEKEPDTNGRSMLLTVKGPGEVTVRALVNNNTLNADCKVIVSGVKLEEEEIELIQGRAQNLSVRSFGEATESKVEWMSDDQSVVTINSGGRISGKTVGKATITVTRGSYTDKCVVTVVEDTSALVVTSRINAGEYLKLNDYKSKLNTICNEKLETELGKKDGPDLSYITNLSVPTKQGIVHLGYISEGDTGAGVGMTEKFYVSPQSGQTGMTNLFFVPKSTFGGDAEISYTGVATDGQMFSGKFRVPVNAMKDVTYTTGKDKPIQFQGNDFNTVCRAHTGRDLSYVTFTLPSESRGTLYYNYTGQTQYAEKVRSNTQYRRTANPNLESVSFVPASGYTGTVSIDYRGVDTAGAAFSGVITITVNNLDENQGDDVYYKTAKDTPVDFRAADFNSAISGTLNYIRFNSLPTSSQGSLRLNYRSSSSNGTAVDTGARYYRTGSHSSPDGEISDITFVPNSTFTGRVTLRYTGYNTSGRYEEGTVSIDVGVDGATGSKTIQYKVNSGKAVSFNADDFNEASIAATRKSLNYIRFDDLPSSSRGTLYYNYNSSTNRGTTVRTNTSYYRNSGNRIGNLSFVSNSSYNGSVSIGYTGWNTEGEKFTGTVNITVGTPTPNVVNYSGTDSSAIRLYSSDVRSACNAVLSKELSYIQFTSLPSTSVGHLYIGYSGLNTGSQVSTGTRYYVSGNPTIDQLSFVPRGGFQGTAVLSYEGYGTDGERVQGEIRINVTAGYSSTNFTDMGRYTWANSAVNFLAQNGVVNGTSPNTFSPGQNVRRCDFVVMICRAFHFTAVNDSAGFYDVPNGTYYTSAVAAARELSIINGTGGNYFNPNGALSRQDAMVMVRNALRAANWSVGSSSTENLSMFPDGGRVSEYARDAVSTLVRLGAVNGDSNGYLRPQSTINRAEVAMILHYVMTM